MRIFEITKLSYYAPNKGYSVKLSEIGGKKNFLILIDSNEAQYIALALEGIQTPRPMTHDIIIDILNSSDVKLEKIEIYKYLNRTFYSRLYLKNFHIGIKKIDCRPSDAIAISLRYFCPIYVKDSVFNKLNSTKEISDETFNSVQEFKKQELNPSENIVKKLNSALDKAINKENYEIAAKLRDKIKSLED